MKLSQQPFGETGLNLPRMGLGLAALGRPGYINIGHGEDLAFDYVVDAMERRTHRLLDLAYGRGIRYFDAARSYGRAEQFLLHWLEGNGFDPQQVHAGSKWGYTYTAGWQVEAEHHEIKEHSLAVLKRQWEESYALRPFLKLYQVHSATLGSGVLENTEVLNYLARLKGEDLLIGLSLSGPEQAAVLEKALAVEIDGRRLFDSVQITFNLLEPSVAPVIADAAAAGLGVIIKEALANGRLTIRNQNPGFANKKAALQRLADRHQTGIDAIALAWVLTHPWAHLVLSGAATERHLLANLDAFQVQLTDDDLTELGTLAMDRDAYWAERSNLKWN